MREQIPSLCIDFEFKASAYFNLIVAMTKQKKKEKNDMLNSRSNSVSFSVSSISTMPTIMRKSPNIPMIVDNATL